MDVNLKEVQRFSEVSMVMGVMVFLFFAFFDIIAGVQINHNKGYGYQQILVMAGSGLYTFWSYCIHLKWKAYLKQIHGLNA